MQISRHKRLTKSDGTPVDSYSYDENGNMFTGGNRTLDYDYDNRPTSIIYNGTAIVNQYDAFGNRVQKMKSSPTQDITKYIGQLYECNGGQCTKYIFAGTKRIAQVKGSDTYYYHTDHLESSTVITDQNGNKIEELLYYPFGEKLLDTSPTSTRYKYAGHEYDSETELIYMKARYYDPKLARFVSPDPVVPVRVELYNFRDFQLSQFRQLTNPQALNRYSYVVNNPIVFRDPLGLYRVSGRSVVSFVGYVAGIASKAPGTVGMLGKAVSAVIIGGTIGYHGIQYARGQESAYKAACESGVALVEGASMLIGAGGAKKTADVIDAVAKGAGVPLDIANEINSDAICKNNQPPVNKEESGKPVTPTVIAPPIDNSGQPKVGTEGASSKQVSPGDSTSHTTTETPEVPVGSTGQGQLGGSSTSSPAPPVPPHGSSGSGGSPIMAIGDVC